MEEVQVVSQLVNDLTAITASKDSSCGPCIGIHRLQARDSTALAGELDLYSR